MTVGMFLLAFFLIIKNLFDCLLGPIKWSYVLAFGFSWKLDSFTGKVASALVLKVLCFSGEKTR